MKKITSNLFDSYISFFETYLKVSDIVVIHSCRITPLITTYLKGKSIQYEHDDRSSILNIYDKLEQRSRVICITESISSLNGNVTNINDLHEVLNLKQNFHLCVDETNNYTNGYAYTYRERCTMTVDFKYLFGRNISVLYLPVILPVIDNLELADTYVSLSDDHISRLTELISYFRFRCKEFRLSLLTYGNTSPIIIIKVKSKINFDDALVKRFGTKKYSLGIGAISIMLNVSHTEEEISLFLLKCKNEVGVSKL